MWQEVIGSAPFRPEWSVLAIDGNTGAVVGAAINCAYEQDWQATGVSEGYTDQLAVARSHRGRGVASALLKNSCAASLTPAWTPRHSAPTQPTPPASAVPRTRLSADREHLRPPVLTPYNPHMSGTDNPHSS